MGKNAVIDMEKTGKVIADKFAEKGMSYTQIASELGVSISTVSYWMNGKKLPSVSHIVLIAGMLECKIDDIIVVKDC